MKTASCYRLVISNRINTNPAGLVEHLYQCLLNDTDCIIDLHPEAYDLRITNVYDVIDRFVDTTGYDPSRITIINGNMIDIPHRYKLIKKPECWYEISEINKWIIGKDLNNGDKPRKHFGAFYGRGTWYRLWLGAILFNKHRDKTIQTFHSSLHCNYVIPKTDGIVDDIGLNDLDYYDCDYWNSIIQFLDICPLNVNENDISQMRENHNLISANNSDCYPIQHPTNLTVLNYYHDLFVDIVAESCAEGECFFLTEKTFRPIIAKRPFINMSCRNTLDNMKKIGFQTFGQWWDESYDDYEGKQRLKMIEQLIDEIATWPIEKLNKTLIQMQEVLEHNLSVFKSLTTRQLTEIFGE